MAEAEGQMKIVDQQRTREWYRLIEDGVPQDVALELLEKEATCPNAPDFYQQSWIAAQRKKKSGKDSLTKAEVIAIYMFTSPESLFNAKFNEDCRNCKWKQYIIYTSLLHTGICKRRRKYQEKATRYYRGISCAGFDASVDTGFLPSFTSTTTSLDVAQMYGAAGKLFEVVSSTTGSIQDISAIECEAEALISPFQCFTNDKSSSQFRLMTSLEPTSPFLASPLMRGTLFGAVVGNSLGSSYEFGKHSTVVELMKNISELEKQSVRQGRCYYSADTCMTFSLAESLTRSYGLNLENLRKGWAEEYARNPHRGYSINTAQVLQELHQLADGVNLFSPARRMFNGEGSYGNGGAMRIAPAALYFWVERPKEFNENIEKITALTHSHPLAINGAILQATAVQVAFRSSFYGKRTTGFHEVFVEKLLKKMRIAEPLESSRPYCSKLEKIKNYLANPPTDQTVRLELGNDASAYQSVPTAIYCFLRGMFPIEGIPLDRTEFERTILYAISLGGDTDTIASMAGAIAGAYYGQDTVTQRWRDLCEAKAIKDAKRYADEIINQRFWDDA